MSAGRPLHFRCPARTCPHHRVELVITDSIQPAEVVCIAKNIRLRSIATLIGEAIARTAPDESASAVFVNLFSTAAFTAVMESYLQAVPAFPALSPQSHDSSMTSPQQG